MFDPTCEKPATDEQRKAVVAAHIASGKTIQAWCADKEYSIQSLNNWRKQWKDEVQNEAPPPSPNMMLGRTPSIQMVSKQGQEETNSQKAMKLLLIRDQIIELQRQYRAIADTLPKDFVQSLEELDK